jgi:hypothetical protein
MEKGGAPGAIGVARGGGGRRSGGGGRVPAVERNPERLVREHLQVGGEAVGALHVRHLNQPTEPTEARASRSALVSVGHPSIQSKS